MRRISSSRCRAGSVVSRADVDEERHHRVDELGHVEQRPEGVADAHLGGPAVHPGAMLVRPLRLRQGGDARLGKADERRRPRKVGPELRSRGRGREQDGSGGGHEDSDAGDRTRSGHHGILSSRARRGGRALTEQTGAADPCPHRPIVTRRPPPGARRERDAARPPARRVPAGRERPPLRAGAGRQGRCEHMPEVRHRGQPRNRSQGLARRQGRGASACFGGGDAELAAGGRGSAAG